MANKSLCSIPDCDKPTYAHGWCSAHYMRWYRNGNPMSGGTPTGEPEKYLREAVMAHCDKVDCLVWPFGRNGKGYGTIFHDGRNMLVTRIVCAALHGEPPTSEHVAAHSCGRGHDGCCNPHHLRWATAQENADDRTLHDRAWKLSRQDIQDIVALKGVETQRAIAAKYGVHYSMISRIHSGKRRASINQY